MATPQSLFSTDPGEIKDLSGRSSAEIFNNSVLPRVNTFLDLLGEDPGGLNEAARRREQQTARDTEVEASLAAEDEDFISQLRDERRSRQQAPGQDLDEYAVGDVGEFNRPVAVEAGESAEAAPVSVDTKGFSKTALKLSNYGYDSDSSPDHNSNVLRIGHANNKLKDGVSAALTKSLARRYGLKTGDYFEVLTDDGKVLRRRYDDTVPTKYKGKPLPETVDLYERRGSNSFAGKVVGLRPLKKTPTE